MSERETMETDVLIVGAGPAGLSTALHLHKLAKAAGAEIAIMVIEKAAEVGNHILSGAVMDPQGINELMPDWRAKGCPIEAEVTEDAVWKLSETSWWQFPITPPPFRNHGNFIVSLGDVVRWMGKQVEEAGIDLFTGFAAQNLILEEGKVKGVVTGDMGIDKKGGKKGTFQPGMEIRAKVTVLAEGTRGHLAKKLCADQKLYKGNPQIYSTGIKEVWKLKPGKFAKGRVLHTMGYPLNTDTFGGSWLYGMADDHLSLGLVVGLDSPDPKLDPHNLFQRFKEHPFLKGLLEGGELVCYGAKTIPDGGWYSRPQSWVDGALLVGDTGGNLDPKRLKGIHLGIKTGMLAAETILDAVKAGDTSAAKLKTFEDRVQGSWIKTQLWKSRNFRGPFQAGGLYWGMFHTAFQEISGGRGLVDPYPLKEDHHTTRKLADRPEMHRHLEKFDKALTYDKLTDVYKSGTEHEEDQPSHLLVGDLSICETKCKTEFGQPCQHFCPAAVYEIEAVDGGRRPKINFSNCVHCKTCDIMDPYQIIDWVTPEGGGGPNYINL